MIFGLLHYRKCHPGPLGKVAGTQYGGEFVSSFFLLGFLSSPTNILWIVILNSCLAKFPRGSGENIESHIHIWTTEEKNPSEINDRFFFPLGEKSVEPVSYLFAFIDLDPFIFSFTYCLVMGRPRSLH